jgi:hypothetical protein
MVSGERALSRGAWDEERGHPGVNSSVGGSNAGGGDGKGAEFICNCTHLWPPGGVSAVRIVRGGLSSPAIR